MDIKENNPKLSGIEFAIARKYRQLQLQPIDELSLDDLTFMAHLGKKVMEYRRRGESPAAGAGGGTS